MSSLNFAVDLQVYETGRRKPQYRVGTDLDGELTLADFLEFTKSVLIVTADTVLREEQARGFDKSPVVVVDNRVGKPPGAVHPLGKIEFTSRAKMDEVLMDTYMSLLQRSPVLTGRYLYSHFVFHNGKQVATDLLSLKAYLATGPEFKDKDLIRFVNIQPYARKLERLGVTAQRQQARFTKSRDKRKAARGVTVRSPNGTYFLTARAIRYKYKRNSIIRFEFISGAQLGIKGNFKVGRNGKPGRPYLYPSILISVQEGGSV